MIRTTLGQLWINEQLPPDMVDYDRVLDKKGVKKLFNELATKHPDKYKEVAQKLLRLGEDAGTTTGSYSFGLQALRQTAVAKKTLLKLEKELDLIYRANVPQKEKEKRILELAHKYRGPLVEQVLEESVKEHNPLALQALSGAKGSKINVNSLRGADILYGDHRGRAIPIPVLHSYSQGLRPHEYVAGAFGARKGVIDLANATRDAGYLAKQLNQMTHRLVVEADEDDNPYDETTPRGYPVETDDADSEGALLSHPIGGYKRNTVITPRILKDLKDKGHDEILVRSPMVGGPGSGGVYSKDVGYRERGRLAPRGDLVGMAAGQSISEPVTQMQISSKHCLAGDTLVRMADFSTRRICDVIAGEWVMGADVEGNTFPVQVIRVYANGEKLCYRTTFGRDVGICELLSTKDHKVVLVGIDGLPQLTAIGSVCESRAAATLVSRDSVSMTPFAAQQPVGMLPTYDLEVDHPSHLFVLANGIIVSNSGGVVGAGHAGGSGFAYINSLVQVPKIFPGGAAHAQVDGRVNSIQEAPQGGHYVTVGSEKHYVGHQFPVTVKIGDHIEAGDTLSEGLPNPGEVVKHKGIGEGRRYLVKAFREALQSSGTGAHRRNLELMARGLINHVRLTDEVGDWVPDDVVPYHMVERNWQPREGHAVVNPKQAVGQYLERPILHYTVGTRIQPSMLKQLERHGVKQVYAHRDPPPFQPEMIRSAVNVAHDPDWMTRMLGSYQQKHLLTGVHRGDVSDESGTSFVPGLARGEHFGRTGKTKTWDPNEQPYTP